MDFWIIFLHNKVFAHYSKYRQYFYLPSNFSVNSKFTRGLVTPNLSSLYENRCPSVHRVAGSGQTRLCTSIAVPRSTGWQGVVRRVSVRASPSLGPQDGRKWSVAHSPPARRERSPTPMSYIARSLLPDTIYREAVA